MPRAGRVVDFAGQMVQLAGFPSANPGDVSHPHMLENLQKKEL